MNRFVIFTDRPYSLLTSILLDALAVFSKAEVVVFSFGFQFEHSHPRLTVIPYELTGSNNFWIERLWRLANMSGSFIVLDADTVPNWNVDELFTLCNRGHRILQQHGVCGRFYQPDLDFLQVVAAPIYCNTVPLIFSDGGSEWLRAVWGWVDVFRAYHLKSYGSEINDEWILNWLRCAASETAFTSIGGMDREWLDSYINAQFRNEGGLYGGDRITWHTFHGEKDEVKARAMFEKLLDLGPDFLFSNPWRNRAPKIFS